MPGFGRRGPMGQGQRTGCGIGQYGQGGAYGSESQRGGRGWFGRALDSFRGCFGRRSRNGGRRGSQSARFDSGTGFGGGGNKRRNR